MTQNTQGQQKETHNKQAQYIKNLIQIRLRIKLWIKSTWANNIKKTKHKKYG